MVKVMVIGQGGQGCEECPKFPPQKKIYNKNSLTSPQQQKLSVGVVTNNVLGLGVCIISHSEFLKAIFCAASSAISKFIMCPSSGVQCSAVQCSAVEASTAERY
jgi:hypothetical protein